MVQRCLNYKVKKHKVTWTQSTPFKLEFQVQYNMAFGLFLIIWNTSAYCAKCNKSFVIGIWRKNPKVEFLNDFQNVLPVRWAVQSARSRSVRTRGWRSISSTHIRTRPRASEARTSSRLLSWRPCLMSNRLDRFWRQEKMFFKRDVLAYCL